MNVLMNSYSAESLSDKYAEDNNRYVVKKLHLHLAYHIKHQKISIE